MFVIDLAEKIGLNREEVDRVLSLNCHTKAVKEDEAIAEEIGINDVPFIIFNEQNAVVGFRSESAYTEILHQLWGNDLERKRYAGGKQGSYCTGTECER